MLEQRTDFTAIRAMTVADREEMTVFESHNVRVSDVSVLVHLVRIMRRNSSFRCERELCDNIDNLRFVLYICITFFFVVSSGLSRWLRASALIDSRSNVTASFRDRCTLRVIPALLSR